ncbi:MAG: CHAT domain-containing protein [Anaerolineae bacterium]
MSQPSLIEQIQFLAAQLAGNQITPTQTANAIQTAGIGEIPAAVWGEIDAQMGRAPRLAHALASIACQVAEHGSDRHQAATAQLARIRTLNALGEFREAATPGPDTARLFLELEDAEGMARAWLEAAWAETYLGNLNVAQAHLEQARTQLNPQTDRRVVARAAQVEGWLLHYQSHNSEAVQQFERARDILKECGEPIQAARCECYLGAAYRSIDVALTQSSLEQARRTLEGANCLADVALCDNFLGEVCYMLNRFQQAVDYQQAARRVFNQFGMPFFAALCDMDEGLFEWELGRLNQALALLERARDYFLAANVKTELASCEVNIALVLIYLYRYDEAIPRLEAVAAQALAEGHRGRATLCFLNLGWAADQQGQYTRALTYYEQMKSALTPNGSAKRRATCERNLGRTYGNLGQYSKALAALEQARALCIGQGLQSDLAETELYHAQVLLALERQPEARAALDQAQALFQAAGQPVYAALCDRLAASSSLMEQKQALARLTASRAVFVQHSLPVDAALCDLTQGEVLLAHHAWKRAQAALAQALECLAPAFPDHAWRADYGLGRVAAQQHQPQRALAYYLAAVEHITHVRAGLGVEQLSNSVFGARRQVFADALRLAHTGRHATVGITVIESAKSQVLLDYLRRPEWRIPTSEQNPVVRELGQRERDLRYQLDGVRRKVSVQVAQAQGEALRSADTLEQISDAQLRELDAIETEYESVVSRLRLLRRGLAGTSSLSPFDLAAFREMAQARWGERWAALDYYLDDRNLTIGYIDAHTNQLDRIALSDYDEFMLRQCAETQADRRELVYRGTLQGRRAPADSRKPLQYLTHKLIPASLLAGRDERTVIVSPHGLLHQLPFHALMEGEQYLLERIEFIYTPSLQALAELCQAPAPGLERLLFCGLVDFGERARPLRHVAQERQALAATGEPFETVLWQEQATRQALLDWNAAGRLRDFSALHFATHAVLEPHAPHRARVLLADGDLTVLDVMDLHLNARFVTLSACSTALGKGGLGDEFVGLVHAFFYAGAHAVVASLWAVEDESTARLMGAFYKHLRSGCSIAHALRAAQLELHRAGFTPYHWAPFVAIGQV